jgi:peroxin-3
MDCKITLLSHLSTLQENIFENVPLETVTERLKSLRGSDSPEQQQQQKQEKADLWERAKLYSFVRTVVALYAVSILNVFLRVQLNIIGRSTYLDSLDKSSMGTLSPDTERKYLAMAWNFLFEGYKTIIKRVQEKAQTVLEGIELTRKLSGKDVAVLLGEVEIDLDDFAELVLPSEDLIAKVSTAGLSSCKSFEELPSKLITVDDDLLKLYKETKHLLSSREAKSVLKAQFENALKHVVTELEKEDVVKPFASYFPMVHKYSTSILSPSMDVNFIAQQKIPAIDAFSAVIYSSYDRLDQ